jgi:hypothetical protein
MAFDLKEAQQKTQVIERTMSDRDERLKQAVEQLQMCEQALNHFK